MTTIWVGFLCALGILAFRKFQGYPSRSTLLEYQRGILYRRGLPVREVGFGHHRVWTGNEKLVFLDTRPIQFSFENQSAALSDGSFAEYGVSGSVRVQDIRNALYSAQNYNQMPGFVFLCCAHFILNCRTSNQLRGSKELVAEEIVNRAKPRLAAAGFELLTFRLSQLSISPSSLRAEE